VLGDAALVEAGELHGLGNLLAVRNLAIKYIDYFLSIYIAMIDLRPVACIINLL
jgi:hypothetical protein